MCAASEFNCRRIPIPLAEREIRVTYLRITMAGRFAKSLPPECAYDASVKNDINTSNI